MSKRRRITRKNNSRRGKTLRVTNKKGGFWGKKIHPSDPNSKQTIKNTTWLGFQKTAPYLVNDETHKNLNLSQLLKKKDGIDINVAVGLYFVSYPTYQKLFGMNHPIENWDVSRVTDMRRLFYLMFNEEQKQGFFRKYTKYNILTEEIKDENGNNIKDKYGNNTVNHLHNMTIKNNPSLTTDYINNNSPSSLKRMFEFDVDLSHWDVSNVTDMSEMFKGQKKLKTMPKWTLKQNCKHDNMFKETPLEKEVEFKELSDGSILLVNTTEPIDTKDIILEQDDVE